MASDAQKDNLEVFSVPLSHTTWHRESEASTPQCRMNQTSDGQTQSLNRTPLSLTRRQLAEIQLSGLLNDPEIALPHLVNDTTRFELDQLAIRLRTQLWLIKRVLRTLRIVETNSLSALDVHILTRVLTGSFDARVLLFFNMIDIDEDQRVTRDELTQFFADYLDGIASLEVFNQAEDGGRRQMILQIIVDKFHLNQVEHLDFDQFYDLVVGDQLLTGTLSRFTVHPTWLNEDRKEERTIVKVSTDDKDQSSWTIKRMILRFLRNKVRMYQSLHDGLETTLTRDYLHENLSRVIFFFLYIAIAIALVIFVIVYRVQQHTHWLEVVARICGMQLNFNCTLMIVLMLRRMARLIRTSRLLHMLVPVDDFISIHKMLGRWLMVLVFIHALFHMIYFRIEGQGYSWTESMFTARAKIGWLHASPLLGVLLSIVLGIMVVCSMKFVRRGGHFEVFYWTHLLYIVFYILLVLHARNFWHWFIGPAIIFVLEKMYSLFKRHSRNKGHTLLHSATIEQANVVKLAIERPPQFQFLPGDYVLINVPQVAQYEWHPFTLSSAPEDHQLLTVHVQSAGNWTSKVFDRYKKIVDDGPTTLEANQTEAPAERVWVDGPYASSARHITDCTHVILIGAGIGITPYASILSSLLAQYRDRNCCGASFGPQNRLIKVDFVWVNRSMDNFEWFLKILASFEQEQEICRQLATQSDAITIGNREPFLDIHLYFTDIKLDVNIGSVPLDLVTNVYEQACHKDVFTRLQSKTHLGRPNWDKLFENVLVNGSNSKKREVGVFFCGPKSMGETVKAACVKHKVKFHKEQF